MCQRSSQKTQNLAQRALIGGIKVYRLLLSPWFGQQCRFYPSCSEYSEQAINHFGAIHGIVKTLGRLLRCHPWHPGGYDPVRTEQHRDLC